VAGAAEPADDAGEVHGGAVEAGHPGDGATKVWALPVEGDQSTCATDAEDVAFGAVEVDEPELAFGDADGVASGCRDAAGGDIDDAAEAGWLAEVEETEECGAHCAHKERETGERAHPEE
jgi:hypothetical protein